MIDLRIERGWSFDGYQLWIIERRNGKSFIAKPIDLEFIEIQDGSFLPEPTLKIDGILGKELLIEAKKALAGFNYLDKESYDVSSKIEKKMQDHIDSLKMVIENTLTKIGYK